MAQIDCKAMTTPMASNLNLLSDASSELVDAMMYHQMIGSLMCLKNTRPDIFFPMNTLIHVHLMVAKRALRHLKGTVDYGLKYEANQKIMWICIGQIVPLIGRSLQGATSVWDQLRSLGFRRWSPVWR